MYVFFVTELDKSVTPIVAVEEQVQRSNDSKGVLSVAVHERLIIELSRSTYQRLVIISPITLSSRCPNSYLH